MIKKKTKQPQVVEGEVVQVDSTSRQIKLVTAAHCNADYLERQLPLVTMCGWEVGSSFAQESLLVTAQLSELEASL